MKTKNIILSGIFAAILCIFSVITIPIGTVPVTLSVFAVVLVSVILPVRCAFLSIIVYIFIGFAGLPVFAGFTSGTSVLFGPTGGYIWSYIFFPLIIGLWKRNTPLSVKRIFVRALIALIVMYIGGTLQFCIVQSVSVSKALFVCLFPFIPFDIIKIVLACVVGVRMKRISALITER